MNVRISDFVNNKCMTCDTNHVYDGNGKMICATPFSLHSHAHTDAIAFSMMNIDRFLELVSHAEDGMSAAYVKKQLLEIGKTLHIPESREDRPVNGNVI